MGERVMCESPPWGDRAYKHRPASTQFSGDAWRPRPALISSAKSFTARVKTKLERPTTTGIDSVATTSGPVPSRAEQSSYESSEPEAAQPEERVKAGEFLAFHHEHPIELPQFRHL
jgi:hypothetical protein